MNVPNPSNDVHGLLKGVSLSNFLQLIEVGGDTCLLEVRCDQSDEIGLLYINEGMLFDATCGALSDTDAAIKILKWDRVEIRIQELPDENMPKKIEKSLAALIFFVQSEDDATGGVDNLLQLQTDKEANSGKNNPEENKGNAKPIQEIIMDVQKLNETVDILKKDLGDGLLATDIFGAVDGQSVAGFNPQPKASALFNKLTDFINDSLEGSGFPPLGKYYIVDLVDGNMVVVIPMGSYRWGMLVNSNKTQMGLLLNIVIPKIIDAFEEAITG